MCLKIKFLVAYAAIFLAETGGRSPDSDLTYFIGNEGDRFNKNLIFKQVHEKDIEFYLYNRIHRDGHRLHKTRQNLKSSGFSHRSPTKILIHGYTGDRASKSIQIPKDAYLSVGEYNVIAVDWSEYSFPYAVAINAARDVGHAIAGMITFLVREGGLKVSDLHIIGHSLGAHVAGYSGNYVRSSLKVARITGLDPAAPTFTDSPPSERLGWEDAQYVDVIHTSIRLLGMTKNIGHADFYPSGGMQQPRCPPRLLEIVTGHCDHNEAYVYFAESIRDRRMFPAVKCHDLDEALENRCMGERDDYMGEDSVRSLFPPLTVSTSEGVDETFGCGKELRGEFIT